MAARCLRARDLATATLREGVDVVNTHSALYAFPWALRLPTGVPLVVHFHGPWTDEIAAGAGGIRGRMRKMAARRVESAVYRRGSRFITLSRALARVLSERYRVPPGLIHFIPGGVDLRAYVDAPSPAAARGRLGWPTDRPILLSVRRLVRRSGLDGLIDAVAELRRRCPEVLLLIGGEGPLAAEYAARVDAAGLAQHVRLLGLVPEVDLPAAYASADLAIAPSVVPGGSGRMAVESLAAGTPVLGTPVGGTAEVLGDLSPSLVFESTVPAAMADRLFEALGGTLKLPSPVGCRAHAFRYGWERVLPQVRHVFDEAVRSQAARNSDGEPAWDEARLSPWTFTPR